MGYSTLNTHHLKHNSFIPCIYLHVGKVCPCLRCGGMWGRGVDAFFRSFSTSARCGVGWSSRVVTARKPRFYVYPPGHNRYLFRWFNQPRLRCCFLLLKRVVNWTNSKEIIVVPLLNFQVVQAFWTLNEAAHVCTQFTECAHNREFRFISQSPLPHGYYHRLLLNMDRRVHWTPRAKFVFFFLSLISYVILLSYYTYELYQKCCSGQQWVNDGKN
jgi:hypothetical protein